MSERFNNNIVQYGKESTPAPKKEFKCTSCSDTKYNGHHPVEYIREDGTKGTRDESRPCPNC